MKEVYFKQIMIADLQNKTARVQPFEKGDPVNLIV